MDRSTILIVGAAGDVGRGIVTAALESGRRVAAAGRDISKLNNLKEEHGDALFSIIAGDIGSKAGAEQLWNAACAEAGQIDEVVISVNAQIRPAPLADWDTHELAEVHSANVLTHFNAAEVFLSRLPDHGMLIGIGGGTADFIMPMMAPASMAQAALRMLYRGLAKERKGSADLRELMIVSMVAGHSNREIAKDDWVRDVEIGRHVCAILDNPEVFPKPILQLRSREQAGMPDSND